MNLKSKVLDYFETYWKKNLFLKSISVIVTVCFLINICNLPAFAKDQDDELLKKRIKKQETNAGVLYQGDQTYGSVSYMQFLQDNTKVDHNNVISVKDKNGKFEAKGYWDPQTQQAMTVSGDGKYAYNETYTKIIKRIKGLSNNADVGAPSKEESAQDQKKETAAQTQTTAAKEVVQAKTQNMRTEKEAEPTPVPQTPVPPSSINGETNKQTTTPTEPETIDVVENKPNDQTERHIDNHDEQYNFVIENLMRETGLSKEQIEVEFAKLNDEQRQNVIDALYNLYNSNKSIVFCAADALGNVLNHIGAGALAAISFALIIADAVAGLFARNNQGLISGTSSQLYISAQAMQTVLAKYGKDYNGYTATIDDIVNGLGLGESAIVHIGGNHFITVTKNEDGTFTLSDINNPNRQVNLASSEELSALLSIYLKGNTSTTVLAKTNSNFVGNKIVEDLFKVIGATTSDVPTMWSPLLIAIYYKLFGTTPENFLHDQNKVLDFFNKYGEESYEKLMMALYGTTNLSQSQKDAFDGFYTKFLATLLTAIKQNPTKATGASFSYDVIAKAFGKATIPPDQMKFFIDTFLDVIVGDQSKAADFYLAHGSQSYNDLMKLMFGENATLTHEESVFFANFYASFLEQAVKGISKKINDNEVGDIQQDITNLEALIKNLTEKKNSESKKEKKENLQSQIDEAARKLESKKAALENAKQRQQALLAALNDAAYGLAVITEVKSILDRNGGENGAIISGEIGQVLLPQVKVDVSGQDLPAGDYYLVIFVTASYAGTQEVEYGSDPRDKRDIPYYRVANRDLNYSVSTEEGCTVTLPDGSSYKVFGVEGEFQGQRVIFQYDGYYQESSGKFYMYETANIYLMDNRGSVYQKKDNPMASPPQSGRYGNSAPERDNWSRGVITEDENGYKISGAGSRVTIRRDSTSGEWEAVIVGIGTEALAGSTLKLGSKDQYGRDHNVYIKIEVGKMTYAGSYWAVSDGIMWQFDKTKTTQVEAEAYVTSILRDQLSAEDNKGLVGDVRLTGDGHIDLNTKFYGAPFSAAVIMHECGLEFTVDMKRGYTAKGDIYKATIDEDTTVIIKEKDYALKYFATGDVNVTVNLPDGWEYRDGSTSRAAIIIAGKEISLSSVLVPGELETEFLDSLARDLFGISFNKLPEDVRKLLENMFSNTDDDNPQQWFAKFLLKLGAMMKGYDVKNDNELETWFKEKRADFLRSKGAYIVNTKDMEMVTGYENKVDENGNEIKDDDGNPRPDTNKPKITVIKAGELELTGGTDGGYATVKQINISFRENAKGSETAWEVSSESTGHFWHVGASVTITSEEDKDGNITYKSSITRGALTVKELNGVHVPKGDDNDKDKDKEKPTYHGPTFDGKVDSYSGDGSGGAIYGVTGTFHCVSGVGLTKNNLGNYIYAVGSQLKEGSYANDGTRLKHNAYVDKDGKIQQIGVKWYEKVFNFFKTVFVAIGMAIVGWLIGCLILATGGLLGLIFISKNVRKSIGKFFDKMSAVLYQAWNSREMSFSDASDTAIKGGRAILFATISAIAVAAIAIASILSTPFSGGSALLGGIAAIGGIISAVAGAVQVGQMMYNAVLAFQYGKIWQGIVSLVLAGVIAALTMFGASQVSSSIQGGLKLGMDMFVKMFIGAAVGAAIGAVSYVVVTAIVALAKLVGKKDRGKFGSKQWNKEMNEEFKNEFDLEDFGAAIFSGAFSGASVGIQVAGAAKAATKEVSDVAAKEVSKEVTKEVSKSVGKSIIRTIIGDVSVALKPATSILNVVTNILKVIGAGIKILFNLASFALNVYISYTASKSFIKAAKEGDAGKAIAALWTLIQMNIISPMMTSYGGEKPDETATTKEEGIELEDLSDKVPETAIEQHAAVPAGVEAEPVKDMSLRKFGQDLRDSLKSAFFDSLGTFGGFSRNSLGSYTTANAPTVAGKAWGGLLGGAAIGMILAVIIINIVKVFENSDEGNGEKGATRKEMLDALWKGALVGAVLGAGFMNAQIKGEYKGVKYKLLQSLNPRMLFQRSLVTGINMSIFSTKFTFFSAILNSIYRKTHHGEGVLTKIKFFAVVDEITGMGLFKSGEELSESGFSQEELNEVFANNLNNFVNPQMMAMSVLISSLLPILGPALRASPFLGTIMTPIANLGANIENEQFKRIFENNVQERIPGFIGGKIFGESSMAAQVFQELFDVDPRETNEKKDALSLLESSRLELEALDPAINDMLKLHSAEDLRNKLNKTFKALGSDVEIKEDHSLGDTGELLLERMDFSKISGADFKKFILTEIVIPSTRQFLKDQINSIIKESIDLGAEFFDINEMRPDLVEKLANLPSITRHKLDNLILPEGLNTAELFNYLYANAMIFALDITDYDGSKPLTIDQINEIMQKTNKNKKPELGRKILVNYASAIAEQRTKRTGLTKGENAKVLADIVTVMYQSEFFSPDKAKIEDVATMEYMHKLLENADFSLDNLYMKKELDTNIKKSLHFLYLPQIEALKDSQSLKDAEKLRAEQRAEIEVLKRKYLKETIDLNLYLSELLNKVGLEDRQITSVELKILLEAPDEIFYTQDAKTIDKLKPHRQGLQKLIVADAEATLKAINDNKYAIDKLKGKGTAKALKAEIYRAAPRMISLSIMEPSIVPFDYLNAARSIQGDIIAVVNSHLFSIKAEDGTFVHIDTDKVKISSLKISGDKIGSLSLEITLEGQRQPVKGVLFGDPNSIALNQTLKQDLLPEALKDLSLRLFDLDIAAQVRRAYEFKVVNEFVDNYLRTYIEKHFDDSVRRKIEIIVSQPESFSNGKLTSKATEDLGNIASAVDALASDFIKINALRTTMQFDASGSLTPTSINKLEDSGVQSVKEELVKIVGDINSRLETAKESMQLSNESLDGAKKRIMDYLGDTPGSKKMRDEITLRFDRAIDFKKGMLSQPEVLMRILSIEPAVNSLLDENRQLFELEGSPVKVSSTDMYRLLETLASVIKIEVKDIQYENITSAIATLGNKDKKDELIKLCEDSGFSESTDLIKRLKILKENLGEIRKQFYGTEDLSKLEVREQERIKNCINDPKSNLLPAEIERISKFGIVNIADIFVEGHLIRAVDGEPKRLREGALDDLRTLIDNFVKADKQDVAANLVQVFANQVNKLANSWALRASQNEMISHLEKNENVALGMGGGKTISLAVDALITRILEGESANIEILVGNGALENYKKEAKTLLEFVGMKVVSSDEIRTSSGKTNIELLRQAYADPDTVVIMDPTARGHLKNEAVSKGGSQGRAISEALDSVKRILVDEVHLWALTRTAAVIGENNHPPSDKIVDYAWDILRTVNAKQIYEQMIKDGKGGPIEITMLDKKVTVQRFINKDDFKRANMKGDWIAIIEEQSSSLEIQMSDDLKETLVKKTSASTVGGDGFRDFDRYNDVGRLKSVLLGLFTGSETGGMKISKLDGTVKPVGSAGIEENMVISDIYRQLGFAYVEGLKAGKQGVSEDRAILGETKLELYKFIQKSTKTSETSIQTSLAAIYSGANNAKLVGVSGTVDGLQQLIINRTGAPTVYNITGEKVTADMIDGTLQLDQPSSDTKKPFSVLGMKLRELIINGDGKGLDNFLLLAKIPESFEVIRQAVKENWDILKEREIYVYEFTDKQGKWEDASGKIAETRYKIDSIAKGKTERRLIIANEMGATGRDYQGNFANIILDSHLMSNTDLAQALKRTARPNSKKENNEPPRWKTSRIIAYSEEKVQAQLMAFQNSSAFLARAREAWGTHGYLENGDAAAYLQRFLKGNLDIKEQLIFTSQIEDLKSTDASVRFAVNDAVRDKFVLSKLRELVASMPIGAGRDAVNVALKETLRSGGKLDEDDLSTKLMQADSPEKFVRRAFERAHEESKQIFENLRDIMKREGMDRELAIIENHLAGMDIALSQANYYGQKPITSKGLAASIDLAEFVQIVRSFEPYIMPLDTTVYKGREPKTALSVLDSLKIQSGAQSVILAKEGDLFRKDGDGKQLITTKGKFYVEVVKGLSKDTDKDGNLLMLLMLLIKNLGLEEQFNKALKVSGVGNENIERQLTSSQVLAYKAKAITDVLWDNGYRSSLFSNSFFVKDFVANIDLAKEWQESNVMIKGIRESEKFYQFVRWLIKEKGLEEQFIAKTKTESESESESASEKKDIEASAATDLLFKVGITSDVVEELFAAYNKESSGEEKKERVKKMLSESESVTEALKDASDGRDTKLHKYVEAMTAEDSDLIVGRENTTLTQKGRLWSEVAKRIADNDHQWLEFFANGPLSLLLGNDAHNLTSNPDAVSIIANALWREGICEFSQVELLFSFYRMTPNTGITSITQLKAVLNATHSEQKKSLAKSREIDLPDARVIEFAKLAKNMEFPEEMKVCKAYFERIVKMNEELEKSLNFLIGWQNYKSEASLAAGYGIWKRITGTFVQIFISWPKHHFKNLSDAVNLSINDARSEFGEQFDKYIIPLMCFAGKLESNTEIALNRFRAFMEGVGEKKSSKLFDWHVNIVPTVRKVVTCSIVGIIGIGFFAGLSLGIGAAIVGVILLATYIVAAVHYRSLLTPFKNFGLGIRDFFKGFANNGILNNLLDTFKNFFTKGWVENKLRITDINKFLKLETVNALIKDGTITAESFDFDKFRAVLDSSRSTGSQELSREEKTPILGEDMVDRMDTLKEKLIEEYIDTSKEELIEEHMAKEKLMKEYAGDSHYIEKQPTKENLKTLAEEKFNWHIASISKLLFERHPKNMTEGFINSPEFEHLAKKLLVVMFNDIKVEKNYDVIIARLRAICLKEYTSRGGEAPAAGKVSKDQNITIDKLSDDGYFDQDNKLTQSSVKTRDEAIREMKPIEAQISIRVDIPGAGTRLLSRMGEGFTKPDELNVALAKALCYFKSVGEMKKFLGLPADEELSDEAHIAQAAFKTYKEALGKFGDGELAENEFKEVVDLARIISDILMLIKSTAVIEAVINKRNFDTIQKAVNLFTVGVNAHIFVNVLKEQEPIVGDQLFGIDISKLKTALEKKDNNKGKRVLSDKLDSLIPMIKDKTLRVDALTSIRNSARAVAVAA